LPDRKPRQQLQIVSRKLAWITLIHTPVEKHRKTALLEAYEAPSFRSMGLQV
jgi:hypothetical protein